MKEILGNNLEHFFEQIDLLNDEIVARTYKGKEYEVWSIPDSMFDRISQMTEERFAAIAGEDAWWRYTEGCVLNTPYETNIVNGHKLVSWSKGYFNCEESRKTARYESLTSYLCNCVGVSQPKNVCALAIDLAKYNNMTLGQLFEKYEG